MPLFDSRKMLDPRFARAVRDGLSGPGQKRLAPEFFYDEIGSALFEVITLLPEYGLTRADRRLLASCSNEIVERVHEPCSVIELGSGSGTKTAHILRALRRRQGEVDYFAIDISRAALDRCRLELAGAATVYTIEAGFLDGVRQAIRQIAAERRVLILFLGSTIGNFDRAEAEQFLCGLRAVLTPGDSLLLGADLVKPVDQLMLAYDDPTGVTAAFNLNLLGRMNRELGASFVIDTFRHLVRHDFDESRIEMHLESEWDQSVNIPGAECTVDFAEGETIWTESSHKYDLDALSRFARASAFRPLEAWIDYEWPFIEYLWEAA